MDGKETFAGTVSLSGSGSTAIVVSIGEWHDDFIVTGWIDLSNMPSGAEVELCMEFNMVPNQPQPSRLCSSYKSPSDAAPLYIKPMMLPRHANMKITLSQTKGNGFSANYWIAIIVPDLGVKQWLMRRFA